MSTGSWEEGRIHLDRDTLDPDPAPPGPVGLEADLPGGLAPCWYFSTPDSYRKWRIVQYGAGAPGRPRPPGHLRIKLGLVGPRWEEHGKRFWVNVWRATTLEDAKLFVERQEGPTPVVTGPKRTEEGA